MNYIELNSKPFYGEEPDFSIDEIFRVNGEEIKANVIGKEYSCTDDQIREIIRIAHQKFFGQQE
jgi:hypothetical protein